PQTPNRRLNKVTLRSHTHGSVLNVNTLATSDGSMVGIPVFAPLAGGKALYIGWVNASFDSGNWIFASLPGWYFADGSDSGVTTQINRYQKPAAGQSVTGWTYGEVNLADGGIASAVDPSYIIVSNNAIKVWQTTLNLGLTVDAASGVFSGSFTHPVTKKATPVKGVLVPVPGGLGMQGLGWFKGPSDTGSIVINQTDVAPPPQMAPKTLTGYTVSVNNNGGTVMVFNTASSGGYSETKNMQDIGGGTMTYAYQMTGLTAGKLKFTTSQGSVGDLTVLWTSDTTVQLTGTIKDSTGTQNVDYSATVVSKQSQYLPASLVGTAWLTKSITSSTTTVATFVDATHIQITGDHTLSAIYTFKAIDKNTGSLLVKQSSPYYSGSFTVIFTSSTVGFMRGTDQSGKVESLIIRQ
ncbi:MAG: hypothetical protein WCO56_28840, partial [Verrucomicrobiota bacterium]